GLKLLERWILRCQHAELMERKQNLRVRWLLDPGRTVLIESSDALLRLDKLGAALRRGFLHEGNNRLLSRSVIPGGQWVSHKGDPSDIAIRSHQRPKNVFVGSCSRPLD